MFPLVVLFVCLFLITYFLFFSVFLLFRSGLCRLLGRPGSDSDATRWSDSKPTWNSIVLPVGHCHKGGEAGWGERNCVL